MLSLALVLSDLLAVVLAFTISFYFRRWLPLLPPLAHGADLYLESWPLLFVWPLAYWIEGLYPGWWHTASEELGRIVLGSTLAGLLMMAETFITHTGFQFSRPIVMGSWLLSLVLVPILRLPLKRLLTRLGLCGPPVVVLGAGKSARIFLDGLQRLKPPPYTPVALFDDDPRKIGEIIANASVVGKLDEALGWAKQHGVMAAILAIPGVERTSLMSIIQSLSEYFPKIIVVPNLFGMATIDILPRQAQGVLGLELRQNLLYGWNQFIKRIIDLLTLLFLFPILLILGLLISLVILIESGRPVFFIHERIGKGGKPFKVWKFRSMKSVADEGFKDALLHDPILKGQWDQRGKVTDDPRVTRVGTFLRRLSLDELPQFWNILKGEMSLVGPRPIITEEIPRYGESFTLYTQVRPGLTGLWQVSGRSDLPYSDRVWLDSHYVRNWSIWLDIVILVRTVGAVFSGRGAY